MRHRTILPALINKYLQLFQCFILVSAIMLSLPLKAASPIENDQNTDATVSVSEIESNGLRISRILIPAEIDQYDLATNETQDELFLTIPFAISSLRIPSSTSTTLINKIVLQENTERKCSLSIKLKSSKLKFFHYVLKNPSQLAIDIWDEQPIEQQTTTTTTTSPTETSKTIETPKVTITTPALSKETPIKTETLTSLPKETKKAMSSKKLQKPLGKESLKQAIISTSEETIINEVIEETKPKSLIQKMLSENEKLYLEFAPLKNDIRLPLEPPKQDEINGSEEDQKLYNIALNLFKRKKYALTLNSIKLFFNTFPNSKIIEEIAFLQANTYFMLGESLKSKNYFDKAISFYKEALRKYPASKYVPQTLIFIGVAYFTKGLFYEALGSFEVGSDKYPDNKYTLLMRLGAAEVYFKIKDYETAIARLEVLSTEYSDSRVARDAIYRLGDVYFEQKKFPEAADRYLTAMQVWPVDIDLYPNAIFNTAESYFWIGKYEESLSTYREFLKLFSKYLKKDLSIYNFGSNALARIGEIMEILGASDEQAKKIYLETEFRFRGSYGARLATIRRITQDLRNTTDKKYLRNSYEEIDKIIKESKENPELVEFASIIKGEAQLDRKDYMLAIDTWEKHILKYPRTQYLERLKNHIVIALKKMVFDTLEANNPHKAIKLYQNNKSRYFTDENSYELMFALVPAYISLGLFDTAQSYLDTSTTTYKKLYSAAAAKERLLKTTKDISDIIKKSLIAMEKGNTSFKTDYAKSDMSFVDDIKTNELKYKKTRENIPRIDDAQAEFLRARILKEKKDYSKAEAICREGIVKYPHEKETFASLLGEILLLTKNWSEAANYLNLSKSNQLTTLKELAYANTKAFKYEKAIEIYENILKQNLVDGLEKKKLLFNVADLNYKAKNYEIAQGKLKKYIEEYPQDEKTDAALYKLGDSLNKLNNTEEALKVWENLSKKPSAGIYASMAEESTKTILWKKKFKQQLR